MRTTRLALTCCLALSGCNTAPPPPSDLDTLLDTIERRLDLAEAVALHKWDRGQPVQAVDREHQVLASARQAASAFQLDPARAEAFFADQIEASKLLQYHLLDSWHRARQAPDLPRRDLSQDVRPALDQLQTQLLAALARFDRAATIDCPGLLADALHQRRHAAARHLALVRASGQLCKTT
ncbi:gamma subclass chorismate mutase AroQ [Pseudomonas maumuensis]|uniref:chorismate mutase n=1 Tax=Pseudomonas maumuensis TaxID=2842354 RepID=A0ABX8NIW1_9PSED|nr:gamma subclass chorismate mutase AroQ [Pseudomonas maumuensis]QXH56271.1 gamma subclass chorismate mutase AroQ [Pseudomonas maumuensis]